MQFSVLLGLQLLVQLSKTQQRPNLHTYDTLACPSVHHGVALHIQAAASSCAPRFSEAVPLLPKQNDALAWMLPAKCDSHGRTLVMRSSMAVVNVCMPPMAVPMRTPHLNLSNVSNPSPRQSSPALSSACASPDFLFSNDSHCVGAHFQSSLLVWNKACACSSTHCQTCLQAQ